MFGKNRIVNKHGLKMVGLKRVSGITKRTPHGRIFWNQDTGNVDIQLVDIQLPSGYVLKRVDDEEAKYKEYLNSLYGMLAVGDTKHKADIKYLYWKQDTLSIIYDGPMTMQEIADAIYEEYREEMEWRETAEENGWRVKE